MDNRHRWMLTEDVRVNQTQTDNSRNRLGTYTYNSLADFEAGKPASFTRLLSPRVRKGNDLGLAFALSDTYRPTQHLQIQYGPRIDILRFNVQPLFNDSVLTQFGVPQRQRSDGRLHQPAHRLQLRLRHQRADRRLPGRAARHQVSDQRRVRKIPEHSQLVARLERRRQHRAAERAPAAHLRRHGRSDRRLAGLPEQPERHPDRLRERCVGIRQHQPERLALRQGIHPAGELPLGALLGRTDPGERLSRRRHRHAVASIRTSRARSISTSTTIRAVASPSPTRAIARSTSRRPRS